MLSQLVGPAHLAVCLQTWMHVWLCPCCPHLPFCMAPSPRDAVGHAPSSTLCCFLLFAQTPATSHEAEASPASSAACGGGGVSGDGVMSSAPPDSKKQRTAMEPAACGTAVA